jgi:hypothetical protein
MIVDFKPKDGGGFTARQQQQNPAVYLDFCALRAIAEQPELSARFIAVMRRARATLLVSMFTIHEFSLLTDPRHAIAADALLHELFMHIYFFNCEPFTVIAAEDAKASAPHGDADFFKDTLLHVTQQEPGKLNLATTFSGHSADSRPVIDQFGQTIRHSFELLQQRLATSPTARRNADNALAWLVGDRMMATKALLTCLIKPLHDDRLPTANDAIDLMHAVVPSAYAEFVVLDRRWASAVLQATQRMRRAGMRAKVAQAFSTRRNGIQEFLSALESAAQAKGAG